MEGMNCWQGLSWTLLWAYICAQRVQSAPILTDAAQLTNDKRLGYDGRLLVAMDANQAFLANLDRILPALLIVAVVGALSTAAGAGGGAIFMPLFTSLLQFDVKGSAAVSQAIITGGAIAGASFALFQKHPDKPQQPLIEFSLALILIPSLLVGTSIGVLLNHIFPVWLITICLVSLLFYVTCKTLSKGLKLYRLEAAQTLVPEEQQYMQDEQGPDESVRNLLRSMSAEAHADLEQGQPKVPASPAAAHSAAHDKAAAGQSTKVQELALVAKAAECSPSDAQLGKLHYKQNLEPTLSNSSVGSLRIKTEPHSISHSGDIPLQELTVDQQLERRASSSSTESESSPASSHSDATAPLIQQTSSFELQDFVKGQMQQGQKSSWPAQQDLPYGQSRYESSRTRWSCFADVLAQPRQQAIAAVVMWLSFASLQIAKGHCRQCSALYWALYSFQSLLLLAASGAFVLLACQIQVIKAAPEQKPTESEVSEGNPMVREGNLTHRTLLGASATAIGGGALAATIGMGGGVIMGPLLLTLHVHPLAMAATSTLMILFSSSAATLSFAVSGNMNWQYALVFAACNFLASLTGVFVIGKLVRKSYKSAIVVLLLAGIMAAGAGISAVFGVRQTLKDFRTDTNMTFSSLCP